MLLASVNVSGLQIESSYLTLNTVIYHLMLYFADFQQRDCTLTWCDSLRASIIQRVQQDGIHQAEDTVMSGMSNDRGLTK